MDDDDPVMEDPYSEDLSQLMDQLLSSPFKNYMLDPVNQNNTDDSDNRTLLASAPQPSSNNPYQTRAKTAATQSGAFSPPRISVTRSGHVYHVEQFPSPYNVDANDQLGPVVHFPDNGAADVDMPVYSPGAQSNSSVTDTVYHNFLEGLNGPSDPSLVVTDDRRTDPTYRFHKVDEEHDEYIKNIPVREIRELKEDLEINPIAGFQITSLLVEEPLIVTRAAARTRHLSSGRSVSSSPGKTFQNQGGNGEQNGFSETDVRVPHINTDRFKKPMPLAKQCLLRSQNVNLASEGRNPSLEYRSTADIYKSVCNRFTRCLNKPDSEFPPSLKRMLERIFDAILNRKQWPPGHQESAQDAADNVVLMDCTLRIVQLAFGDIVVSQLQSTFQNALAVDKKMTYLIFALLIHDGSPLILELAPILYGKTAIMKSLTAELRSIDDMDVRRYLINSINGILARNRPDDGKGPVHDLDASTAGALKITGHEGSIPEEICENFEEEITTEAQVRDTITRSRNASKQTPKSSPAPAPIPPVTRANPVYENISDNSNSSHFYPKTPGTPGGFEIPPSEVSMFLAEALNSTAKPTSSNPEYAVWGESDKVPRRRVPLLTSALTGSPLKNPHFASVASPNRERYLLRSRNLSDHEYQ